MSTDHRLSDIWHTVATAQSLAAKRKRRPSVEDPSLAKDGMVRGLELVAWRFRDGAEAIIRTSDEALRQGNACCDDARAYVQQAADRFMEQARMRRQQIERIHCDHVEALRKIVAQVRT
jgi:hypothetical protein